jgi:tRNA-2-methylthio-N6-dimethylallyladenosine synthase
LLRIRFTAPHPGDFSDELLHTMVSYPKICNHIHLPLQAGSTRVLRAMRRGYTREYYLRLIDKIHGAPRPIAVSTDIIVGFPGETDEDFQDTLSLLDAAQFDGVFSFKYSPRPNTAALRLPGVLSEEIQTARLGLLQEHQRLIQYNRNAAYLGTTVQVLADGQAKANFDLTGRTGENKVVNFDGPVDLLGTMVPVEVTGFGANSLKGVCKR